MQGRHNHRFGNGNGGNGFRSARNEYRNFNRSSSFQQRGPPPPPPPKSNHHHHPSFHQALPPPPRPPPPPPPPPRRPPTTTTGSHDVFMQAGRLAAEYLVSQGVLPADLLRQIDERDNPPDNRTSALSRLGNDFNNPTRNHFRQRTRVDDLGRDNGKANASSPWSDRPIRRSFLDAGESADNLVSNNGMGLDITPKELPSKTLEQENYDFTHEAGQITPTQLPLVETDNDFSKVELKDGTGNNDEIEKQDPSNNFFMQHSSIEESGFGSVPTNATTKGSKIDPVPTADEENECEISPLHGLKVTVEKEAPVKSSSNDIPGAPSIQSVEDSAYALEMGECKISESLPYSPIMYEQESGQDLTQHKKSSSEKRTVESHNTWETSKKQRETPSAMDGTNEYLHEHNFSGNLPHSNDKSIASDEEVVEVTEEGRLLDVAFFPIDGAESGIEFREEKQLFPSSFKICDLNLMEATESHDCDAVLKHPSASEAKNELPVDVDLTISNNCNRSEDYDKSSADAHEAIIIEVEDDFPEEDKIFDTSEGKTETVHPSLESFPNHMESTGDIPDAQDGYGLMISELLGNDISSPVPADITGLPTDMDLHDGAGILGDDDPIYLSLGEIPISFLGAWGEQEQASQQYEKPF